jgi:streptogramin lyase
MRYRYGYFAEVTMKRNDLSPTFKVSTFLGNPAALLAGLTLFCMLNAPASHAQGVKFAWAQSTVSTFSPNAQTPPAGNVGYTSVATDTKGNVFVIDPYGVQEFVAVNGSIPSSPGVVAIAPMEDFVLPYGLVINANGDIFVADSGRGIVEIEAVNGVIPANPSIKKLDIPVDHANAITIDGKGDLFVIDNSGPNQGLVLKEIEAVNGDIPNTPKVATLGTGGSALTVDPNGNIFMIGTIQIVEILAVDGSIPSNPTVVTLPTPQSTATIPDDQGYEIASDSAGNVYFTYETGSASRSVVKLYEYLAVDGSVPAEPVTVTLGNNLSLSSAIAAGLAGNIFFAQYDPTDKLAILTEMQLQSVDFGTVNVCSSEETLNPCTNDLSLTFQVAAGTTIGGINILTAGEQDLDFRAKSGDTSTFLCPAKTYGSATTCSVDVTFAPLASGKRNGTVEILDAGGNTLASVALSGLGANQTITFPAVDTQVALDSLDLTATASSGLPVTFLSSTPQICTVSGSRTSLLTAGDCHIQAYQPGNDKYFAAFTNQSILVHHHHQVITFPTIPPQKAGNSVYLGASTDSNLPLSSTSTTPAVCSAEGVNAYLAKKGTCTIVISQAGNDVYFASSRTQSFTVQ